MLGELDEEDDDFEDDLVFDDDILTWRDVEKASGAGQPLKYTRRQTQLTSNKTTPIASTSRKDKGKKVMEVVEEEDFDDEVEEEDYKSGGDDEVEEEEDFNLDDDED
ncbi:hypothetical protein Fmac_015375 [Flemingia macrophylla]|uniref:Uncharacterized protein n=1 Tax=Flemingia macrophylla TaxID=520843 RepID=A0ABD1MEH0_9FABA